MPLAIVRRMDCAILSHYKYPIVAVNLAGHTGSAQISNYRLFNRRKILTIFTYFLQGGKNRILLPW